MTEKELIEIAKHRFHELRQIEDKSLITKNVIDNIQIWCSTRYHRALEGVAPENISKDIALKLLKYDKEMYGLLTKELQADSDILEMVTKDIEKLPESLFNSKDGINYVLDKWNVEGKSVALCKVDEKSLIIKKDVNTKKYIMYLHGFLVLNENANLSSVFLNTDYKNIQTEVFFLLNSVKILSAVGIGVKHIV